MPLLGQQAPYAFIFSPSSCAESWPAGAAGGRPGRRTDAHLVRCPSIRAGASHRAARKHWGAAFSTASQLLILAVIFFYQREVTTRPPREGPDDLLSEALARSITGPGTLQTVVACNAPAQRATTPEVRDALQQAADRVNAVSLASEHLALRSEDLGTVRLGDHLCELCAQIARGLTHDGVKLECDVHNFTASTEKAIPLSIIVNELVTNALKHAFEDTSEGVIRVASETHPKGVTIIVEDNGRGIARARQRPRQVARRIGTRLVERFVADRRGAQGLSRPMARYTNPRAHLY